MTINIPTRVTESTAMIIAQIITNISAKCYYTDVINSLLSDHSAQCITIIVAVPKQTRCYKEIRNVSEHNVIGHCSLKQMGTWSEVFREIDVNKIEILLQHF
jgi:hypothetical protein